MPRLKFPTPSITATLAPETANGEERTVDVTFYSGAAVPRFSWLRGEYALTLETKPEAVRLGTLNSGTAPVLEAHSDWSTRDVLGVVEKGWLDNGSAMATMRFAKGDEDADRVWNKIGQKILRNVSMGVRIHKMRETSGSDAKVKSYLATDWEPFEISVVPIGADPGAHIEMSLGDGYQEIEIEEFARATSPEEAPIMPEQQRTGEEARVDNGAATQAAQLAERNRVLEITKIASVGKLDVAFAVEHVEKGTSAEEFRRLAFERLAARSEVNPTRGHHAEVTRDQRESFRAGAVQSILFRADPRAHPIKDSDPGYDYRGCTSLLRLAEESVRMDGRNPSRMSPNEIAKFAMSSSDFPYILADSANKSLRAGYAKMPSSWRTIGARRTAANFKAQYELQTGMTATFPQVKESGEYQEATVTDGRETWRVYTYGNILSFTRVTIINDDLGALTNIPAQMGMKAAQRQAALFWAVLTTNGNLSDNVALFDAGHANLVTPGTAINVDNLGIARKMLRVQTDLGGDTIDLDPRYLVVPAAKEQLARQYMSANYTPTQNSGVNPWANTLEIVVEPRLDASSTTAWYLFADPSVAPVLIYAFLNGEEGVYSEMAEKTNPDVTQWLARFDFGVGGVDFRGAVKNLGA